MVTTLACQDVQAEISNYLDDDLSPDTRRALDAHLASCRTCQILLDSVRKTLRIVTDSGSFDLPLEKTSPLVKRIMARVRREDAKP